MFARTSFLQQVHGRERQEMNEDRKN